MKIEKYKIIDMTRYPLNYQGEKYYIEIIYGNNSTEFWLYKKDYGVKSLMFEIPEILSNEAILDLISRNVKNYIRIYKEDVEE